jgi:hypothetical protein
MRPPWRWFRRSRELRPLTDDEIDALTVADRRMAARLRRLRDGQDIEVEQVMASLRGNLWR